MHFLSIYFGTGVRSDYIGICKKKYVYKNDSFIFKSYTLFVYYYSTCNYNIYNSLLAPMPVCRLSISKYC